MHRDKLHSGRFAKIASDTTREFCSIPGTFPWDAVAANQTGYSYDECYEDFVDAADPLAYWRLDETSGTFAADASGHAHNGTYRNMVAYAKPGAISSGTSVHIGSSGTWDPTRYISVPPDSHLQTVRFTAEAWARIETAGGSWNRYVMNQGGRFFIRQAAGGAYEAAVVIAGTTFALTGSTPAHDGAWHHVALTYDGVNATLYLDGFVEATIPLQGSLGWNPAEPLYIGNLASNMQVNSFAGDLDEVALYNRALTQTEIADHAGQAAAIEVNCEATAPYAQSVCGSEPLSYWRLGEQTGPVAADRTSPPVDGTYVNVGQLGKPGVATGNSAVNIGMATGTYDSARYVSVPWVSYGRHLTRDEFSFEVWVKTSVNQGDRPGWVAARSSQFWIRQATGTFEAMVVADNTEHMLSGPPSILIDGEWHHLVLTHDGQTAKFFIDGSLADSKSVAGRIGWGTNSGLMLGNHSSNTPVNSFGGDLDEVAMYARALPLSEISDHFAAADV